MGSRNQIHRTLDPIRSLTGTADIDVSAGVYTAAAGVELLRIEPSGQAPLEDVYVEFDLAKATTGFAANNTTETISFIVSRKVDGTNYRSGAGPNQASTAISGTNAAGRSIGLHIGSVLPTEDVRVTVVLSAETGGDVELPFVLYYRGVTPTVTAVAAA